MKLLLIFFLLLIQHYSNSSELCCVRGYVHDAHGIPMIGATVVITGTSLGAMTDTTGHYFIADVPVGSIELHAKIVGKLDQVTCETGLPGDTLEVNFALGPRYMPDITWKYNDEIYSDTISITVSTSMDLDEAYPQIWAGDNLMPCWRESHITFGTTVSSREESLQFSLFPYGQLSVALADSQNVYYIQYPRETHLNTQNQCINSTASHNLVDLAEWGNPILENWGFLGSKTVFENDSMNLLLVFCEQAVLVDETGAVEVIDYPFPTFHFRTDPKLNYLLIWDICGKEAIGGNAALISLENNTFSVFDPSPEKELPDVGRTCLRVGVVLASNFITGQGMYHVTSDGNTIRLNETDIRLFNNSGELTSTRSLEDLGLIDIHYAAQFLSEEQNTISVIHTCDSLHYRLTVNLHGDILYHSTFPYPEERPVLRIRNLYDTDNSVLWFSHQNNPFYGIARVDCMGEDYRHIPGLTRYFCTSDNRKYIGMTRTSYEPLPLCTQEIRDWNTGDLLFTLWEESPSAESYRFQAISNTGLSLLSVPSLDSENESEFVLTDTTGNILWHYPNVPSTQLLHTKVSISPDGSLITIPFGRYIDLITISSECKTNLFGL